MSPSTLRAVRHGRGRRYIPPGNGRKEWHSSSVDIPRWVGILHLPMPGAVRLSTARLPTPARAVAPCAFPAEGHSKSGDRHSRASDRPVAFVPRVPPPQARARRSRRARSPATPQRSGADAATAPAASRPASNCAPYQGRSSHLSESRLRQFQTVSDRDHRPGVVFRCRWRRNVLRSHERQVQVVLARRRSAALRDLDGLTRAADEQLLDRSPCPHMLFTAAGSLHTLPVSGIVYPDSGSDCNARWMSLNSSSVIGRSTRRSSNCGVWMRWTRSRRMPVCQYHSVV